MTIYNIVKIEASGTSLSSTVIGYINSEEDRVTFEGIHGTPLVDWAAENPSADLTTYFETNDPCYLVDTAKFLQDDLPLITNFENPEG